jgi:hypothetical protein
MMRLPVDTQAVIRKIAATEHDIAAADTMDIGKLTHEIVKSSAEDQRLHLVAITRRLLYCCPLHAVDQ